MVWRYVPQSTSQKMPTLRFGCWPHTLFKLDKLNNDLQADISGGPLCEAYFICGVEQLGDGTNPDQMSFQFIITYNVTFSNPIKNQTQN